MCLWNTSEEVERDYRNQDWGWKVFNRDRKTGKIYGKIFNNYIPRPVGEWLNEKLYRTPSTEKKDVLCCEDDCSIAYATGWHIYLEKEDAEMDAENDKRIARENSTTVVRKVFFKNPFAWGQQGINEEEQYLPVVVAEDMMIEDASVA
jgi:hypothetical protein